MPQFKETALVLGCSRARVAQIERRALRKLRRALARYGIVDRYAFASPDNWEPAGIEDGRSAA